MAKSKVKMPEDIKKKCHVAIHTATAAAGAAGAIPIPMADALPITAAQITMIVALGKVFDVSISQSVARSVIGCGLATQVGRAVFTNVLKAVPVAGQIAGPIVAASTAVAVTEALGWVVADDFYRLSVGKNPENLVGVADDLKKIFDGLEGSRIFKGE